MLNKNWILAAVAAVTLAGCLENDSQRALVGAGAGCAVGEALRDGSCVEGALAGGLIGALANDI